jgi:UDPglucose 6-dehydrogenase
LIEKVLAAGAKVQAYDPVAISEARKHIAAWSAATAGERSDVIFTASAYDALKGADALVLVTEWNEFRNPDLSRVKTLLKNPIVFDGRNIYQPETIKQSGFTYYGIGRAV